MWKKILKLFSLIFLSIALFWSIWFEITNAGYFDSESDKQIEYCDWGGCGLQEWADLAASSVEWVVTEWTATDQIQKIIVYLLSFITFIAVVYIVLHLPHCSHKLSTNRTIKKTLCPLVHFKHFWDPTLFIWI